MKKFSNRTSKPGPVCHLLDFDNNFPSVLNLTASLYANGSNVLPDFRFNAKDVTSTSWPRWGYGASLDAKGSGGTIKDVSFFCGNDDYSFRPNSTAYFSSSAGMNDTTVGAVGTNDFCFELIWEQPRVANEYVYHKRDAASAGMYIFNQGDGSVALFLSTTSASVTVSTSLAGIKVFGVNHIMIFVNRSENSTNGCKIYVNGVLNAQGNAYLSGNSCTSTSGMGICGTPAGANLCNTRIYYIAMWQKANWFQEGTSGPAEWVEIAKNRYRTLMGVYPNNANGLEGRTISIGSFARNGEAFVDTCNFNNSATISKTSLDSFRVEGRAIGGKKFRGILLEPSVTNMVTRSEELNNASSWTTTNSDFTSAASIQIPTGYTYNQWIGSNSLIIRENTTNGYHSIQQTVALTANKVYTFSIWAKTVNRTWIWIAGKEAGGGSGTEYIAYYNISSKVAGITSNCFTTNKTYINSWERFSITFVAADSSNHTFYIGIASADNTRSYAGIAANPALYLWGVQLENSSYPTSYIYTTTTTVARAAETFNYDLGTNIMIGNEGLIEIDYLSEDPLTTYTSTTEKNIMSLTNNGSTANAIELTTEDKYSNFLTASFSKTGESTKVINGTTDIGSNTVKTISLYYNKDSAELKINNSSEGTITTIPISSFSTKALLELGDTSEGITTKRKLIKNIRIYPSIDPRRIK